ncbi:MAG: tRNA pseudouridine(55) synthase TruB, partial [Magnetospirillum sp.]
MARKRKGLPLSGWIALDKPLGMSSAQAVAAVRRITGAAKVGHGGTLDPLATGVLPIALGEATKTVAYVMDGAKTYRWTLAFGE